MKIKNNHRYRIPLATAVTVLAVGSTSACGTASATGQTVVRYQSYAGAVDPLQLADALGKLPNIKLDKVGNVTGGPQSLQALISNQVDISSSAFFGAIAQLVATGAPIKAVIASYGTNVKTGSAIVAPANSTLTSDPHSLIGKKVAVNTLGANAEAIIDTWFANSGLTADEIKKVVLVPLPPLNTVQALKQGQVDAGFVGTAQIPVIQAEVPVKTLVTDAQVIGNYDGGGLSLRTDWIKNKRDVSKTLVAGVAAALDYINTHGRQQVLDIYEPWLKAHGNEGEIAALEKNWNGQTGISDKGARITDHDIELWLKWLGTRGDVDLSKVKPADVYTNELNPNQG